MGVLVWPPCPATCTDGSMSLMASLVVAAWKQVLVGLSGCAVHATPFAVGVVVRDPALFAAAAWCLWQPWHLQVLLCVVGALVSFGCQHRASKNVRAFVHVMVNRFWSLNETSILLCWESRIGEGAAEWCCAELGVERDQRVTVWWGCWLLTPNTTLLCWQQGGVFMPSV